MEYLKIKRSKELLKYIEIYWGRPFIKCDVVMVKIAEEEFINSKKRLFEQRLINKMYCITN